MPSQRCPACSSTVPPASRCLDCGEALPSEAIPSRTTDEEVLRDRLQDLAARAHHETVTVESLGDDYGAYDRPLGDYLFASEQPVALFGSPGVVVEGSGGAVWKAKSGLTRSGHVVVTDERVIVLVPGGTADGVFASEAGPQSEDLVVPVDYRFLATVDAEPGLLRDVVQLETVDGHEYGIGLARETEEELAVVVETVREFSEAVETDEPSSARLRRAVDDAVATEETAEGLLRAMTGLVADSDETTSYDDVVAEASSFGDLLTRLERLPSVSGGAADGDARSQGGALVPRSEGGSIRQQVSHTLRNADPAEVGKYTIAAGIGFGAYAVSAPFSTAAGLAALAAGGAATGAYASSHPHSLAAQVDPVTLATRARVRGDELRDRSAPGGVGAGSALGALEYLADADLSPEHARWLANADVDRIRRGAELGARAAEDRDDLGSTAAAAALGGGFGLAYGYVDEESVTDFEALLDEDLVDAAAVLEEGDAPDGDPDDTE